VSLLVVTQQPFSSRKVRPNSKNYSQNILSKKLNILSLVKLKYKSYLDNNITQINTSYHIDLMGWVQVVIIDSFVSTAGDWIKRLNRKNENESKIMYRFINRIGTGTPNEKLVDLVNLHLGLTDQFDDVGFSQMHAG
jgi:hypothetical protein